MRGLFLPITLIVFSAAEVIAQPPADSQPDAPASAPAEAEPMSLIHDLPDYTGDWLTRKYLTGDWGGARTELANHGILFDLDLTQYIQGNAHGGKDTNNAFRYSGSADYYLNFDTARMGLWPGGLITLHGETQIGQSINSKVGSMMTPNFQALLPVPGDSGATTLSEFYLTQALSKQVILRLGKMDLTASGDQTEFAGNHRTQFWNTAFKINPVLFNAGPYTTMGAAVILIPTEWLTVVSAVVDNDPEGAANMTGFNTAFHGRNWLTVTQEYDFTWKPFGQTGHQRVGWFWTSKDFRDFPSDLRLQSPWNIVSLGGRNGALGRFSPFAFLPDRFGRQLGLLDRLGGRLMRRLPGPARGIGDALPNLLFGRKKHGRRGGVQLRSQPPDTRPDDWALYYNFDQYLYTLPDDPEQGFGVFGRFGLSTGEANLVQEFYSLGVGGKGMIPHRERDTYGVGYYCLSVSDNLRSLLGVQAEQGVEAYYNIEVTPWLHITPDVQVIVDPAAGFRNRDVALVYGVRAQIKF